MYGGFPAHVPREWVLGAGNDVHGFFTVYSVYVLLIEYPTHAHSTARLLERGEVAWHCTDHLVGGYRLRIR